ncbi:MAG: TonB-dependent receptor [Bacteroidales bacterium]|nr:TonB-dependent receptor [Bacteroidales bacterium]
MNQRNASRLIASRLLAIMVMLSMGIAAQAAAFQVKGVVEDSIGDPASYATIHIYQLPDSLKSVADLVTKEDGSFTRTLKQAGNYRLTVTVVGYTPLAKDFSVSEAHPVADLGKLLISTADNLLAEVEVVAQKPLVTTEIDRMTYDVTADGDSKTSMTYEILRKVPMVEVDGEGNITINGSSNFKIYKNGRPDKSFSNNAQAIFKALPASMIEKIEVITEPGSREDMEGVDAILNIVTVSNSIMKGVTGNVGLYVNNYGNVRPNTYITTQLDKVTAQFYGGMNISSTHGSASRGEAWQDYEETGRRLESSTFSKYKGVGGYWGLSASYEMDTLRLFNLDFGGYDSRAHSYTTGSQQMLNSRAAAAADALIYSYNTVGETDPSTYSDINLGLNYQRSTRKKGEYILLSYRLATSENSSDITTRYTDMINMPVSYTGIISDSKNHFTEHTVQLDWSRPLGHGQTLDLGAKYIDRRNHNKANQEYIGYETSHTDFEHTNNIAAVYFDYRANLKKWGFRAGLRYEYTHLNAEYKEGEGDNFKTDLNDWAPNATISYQLRSGSTLKLSATSAIRRPGISYLNPTVYETPTTVSYGNPDLESERLYQFRLLYTLFSPSGLSLNVSTWYSWADNNIIPVQWGEGDVTYSTYANDGHDRTWRTQLSFSTYLNRSKKTYVSIGGSFAWNSHENPNLGLYRQDWSGRLQFSARQNLPYSWRLSTFFYWNSPNDRGLYNRLHFRGGASTFWEIALNRSFLKDERLSLGVVWANPFGNHHRGIVNESVNMPYTGESATYTLHPQSLYISVSYRFGSLKAQVKKVQGGVNNDDVVGGVNRQ